MLFPSSCPETPPCSGSRQSRPSKPLVTRQSRARAERVSYPAPSFDYRQTRHSTRSPRTLRNARRWRRRRSRAHSIRARQFHRAHPQLRGPGAAAPTKTPGRSPSECSRAPAIHRDRKAVRDDVCWQFLACVELAKSENQTHHDSKSAAPSSLQQASIWQSRDPR